MMKNTICVIALFLFVNGYAQKPVSKTVTPPQLSPAIKLKNTDDSTQYSLGSFLAQWINSNGFQVSNPTLFIRAMDDVFLNKPRSIPDSLIENLVLYYQQSEKKNKAVKDEQQLFSNLKDKTGIGTFPNGIKYSIIKTGKGQRPAETDSILLNLIAKLPDGTVVEDTYQTKKPFAATPASFFPGLTASLQEMPEGSKWTLYIPAALAYAEKGTALIPPNSALVLEIELLQVRSKK
jgi:FKBP-type peptidyl-prolyl cis-trans isomerase FklB